jgi:hypothetical protein
VGGGADSGFGTVDGPDAGLKRRFARLNREGLSEHEIAAKLGLSPAIVDLLMGVEDLQARRDYCELKS